MRRGLVGLSLIVVSGCSFGASPAPTPAPAATQAPTVAAPTATRAAAPATATPAPKATPTPEPSASDTVYVGNTDGQGVFIRKTPAMADRVRAYQEGTPLTIIGDDEDGDGQHWKHVRTPDGLEGYVPSMYTVAAPP